MPNCGRVARGYRPLSLRRYVPQFDGVRALAISAVVAYHLGYLRGGWVGVDVFFVLSGYLITSLLLAADRGRGHLVDFWGRRAKRLLPAVLVLLVALSLYAWAGGPGLVPAQLRAPSLATLFYVANWQQIIAGHADFARYLSVSPLQHTWSLAIEEQYYVVWPLVILGLTSVARSRRHRDPSQLLLVATVTLAVASAVWMGLAADWLGPNRAYLGTDTRAWELLLGGAAAMIWPPGSPLRPDGVACGRVRGAGDRRRSGRDVAGRWPAVVDLERWPRRDCVLLPSWSFWARCLPPTAWSVGSSPSARCGGWGSFPTASTCGTGR